MNSLLLNIMDLNVTLSGKKILNGMSFDVNKGEVLGILGPNGAGKSTTFNVITGLLDADSGSVRLEDNKKPRSKGFKKSIGVVPQDISLYADMTVEENLNFFGKMYGLRGAKLKQSVSELISNVHLVEKKTYRNKKAIRRHEKAREYCGGFSA